MFSHGGNVIPILFANHRQNKFPHVLGESFMFVSCYPKIGEKHNPVYNLCCNAAIPPLNTIFMYSVCNIKAKCLHSL